MLACDDPRCPDCGQFLRCHDCETAEAVDGRERASFLITVAGTVMLAVIVGAAAWYAK